MAQAGPDARLSASEMVHRMAATNPNAATALDRILRILAANSILSFSLRPRDDGSEPEKVYGLTSESRWLVPGDDGASVAPEMLLTLDKAVVESFYCLQDAVVEEGCIPFEKAHGTDVFEYGAKEPEFNKAYPDAMNNGSAIALAEVFKVYKGFDGVTEMVDVGGGTGVSIGFIVSRYPNFRGVNFDLPHIISHPPPLQGVEHVGGNMFEEIPNEETIFMKWILHNWDDGRCVTLLKKCWRALPHGGKVIIVEFVIPPVLGTDAVSRYTLSADLFMMACNPGGKERTVTEFYGLAMAAGFAEMKNCPIGHGLHVIEFHK
nr:TPA_asm: hypothetical protein HUJ06_014641 [Nelumbo nucifera]